MFLKSVSLFFRSFSVPFCLFLATFDSILTVLRFFLERSSDCKMVAVHELWRNFYKMLQTLKEAVFGVPLMLPYRTNYWLTIKKELKSIITTIILIGSFT